MERDTENGRRMTMPRIAILCPIPEYEEDWSHIKADYARLLGPGTVFIDWTKAEALAAYDLVTPLLAWGYQRDCPCWFALLSRLEAENIKLSNPARILRWNSDKAYLAELESAGIASVPTRVAETLDMTSLEVAFTEFDTDTLVIKPPISGGADGTFRLAQGSAIPDSVVGRRMMIQPYLPAIAAEGEYSLFYFNGQFSHSIIKRPAEGDFRVQDQFGGHEADIVAPNEAKALALAALAAASDITDTDSLAYARVDMVRDDAGTFRLMELELIEPSLFLRFAKDDGAAFAAAIMSKI
jgi:glutathione synthase/RimK-type ligase-like ATP-grasp enzyme